VLEFAHQAPAMAWAVACELMPLRSATQGLSPMRPGMLPLMSGLVAPKPETVAVMSVVDRLAA